MRRARLRRKRTMAAYAVPSVAPAYQKALALYDEGRYEGAERLSRCVCATTDTVAAPEHRTHGAAPGSSQSDWLLRKALQKPIRTSTQRRSDG